MTSNERVTFLSPELINKLEQDRDYRFKKSITRLIVRTDRETQEVVGFTMTIIPSIEYLELTAFNPFHNTYVNRDEHFGGYIIYHNLGGNMLTEKSHTQYQNLLFQLTLSKIAHQFKQECMKNVKNSYTKY